MEVLLLKNNHLILNVETNVSFHKVAYLSLSRNARLLQTSLGWLKADWVTPFKGPIQLKVAMPTTMGNTMVVSILELEELSHR